MENLAANLGLIDSSLEHTDNVWTYDL